jgi:hypothetical protein
MTVFRCWIFVSQSWEIFCFKMPQSELSHVLGMHFDSRPLSCSVKWNTSEAYLDMPCDWHFHQKSMNQLSGLLKLLPIPWHVMGVVQFSHNDKEFPYSRNKHSRLSFWDKLHTHLRRNVPPLMTEGKAPCKTFASSIHISTRVYWCVQV